MPRPPKKTQAAYEWMKGKIEAGEACPSLRVTMDELKVARNVAVAARDRLKAEGLVKDLPRTPAAYRSDAARDSAPKTLEQLPPPPIPGEGPKTPEQLRDEMAKLFDQVPHSLKPQVARELGRLNRELGAAGQALGPGIPRTRDDMIFRGSLILKALGERDATEAWNLAFQLEAPNGAYVAEVAGGEASEDAQGDARVQDGDAALRFEGRPAGDVSEAGDSDRAVGGGPVPQESPAQ